MRNSILFVLSLILTSCSSETASDAQSPLENPESVGMSADGLDLIRPAMQRLTDEGMYSGIVSMVARKGEVVYWDAVGYGNIESQRQLEPNDIFRICSMTKPITSVGAMMLIEAGALSLSDPVSKYIPSFEKLRVYADGVIVPLASPITVEHLFSHTSGLSYGFQQTHVDSLYRAANLNSGDLSDFVEKISELPLVGQPGSLWHYSVSTDVLGRIIEVVSGQPLNEFLKSRVIEPLSMVDTGFHVPPEKLHRLARLYRTATDGSLEHVEISGCADSEMPKLFKGGAGLLSTASDYMRFSQMLLNGGELDGIRILKPETVKLMRTNHLPEKLVPIGPLAGYGFGFGFAVLVDADSTPLPDTKGVFRWGGAHKTTFWIDPEEELIGIALTQIANGSHAPIDDEFQTLVYEAINQ